MTAAVPTPDLRLQQATEKKPESFPNRCVYLVSNWPGGGNDRVKKVARLRDQFEKLVLVTPGKQVIEDETTLMLPKIINPLGILRKLGLSGVKQKIEKYLYFPSTDILFVYRVRKRLAARIAADLERGKQVTLVTTAPPHALGLIGLYVKRKCPAVRWVLDWQDLWSYDENYYLLAPPAYRPLVLRQERAMLNAADLNVTTNAVARKVLETRYDVPAERLSHINHHFDCSDFEGSESSDGVQNESDSKTMRIGFLGSLFKPPRVPGREIVAEIEAMRNEGLSVELHIHGLASAAQKKEFQSSDAIHLHGWVSHEESVSKLAKYDYLLLLLADLPNCQAVMSIKLPHYMAVERPIVAIVPDQSAIAEIIRDTGTGVVLPVAQDWRTMLRALVAEHGEDKIACKRNSEAVAEYSWERISETWVETIVGSSG